MVNALAIVVTNKNAAVNNVFSFMRLVFWVLSNLLFFVYQTKCAYYKFVPTSDFKPLLQLLTHRPIDQNYPSICKSIHPIIYVVLSLF